jgi:S-adenosylmethionine synthetase
LRAGLRCSWQVNPIDIIGVQCPGAIIRDLKLRQPIYRKTAAYGHFGRDDIEFPWERTDKAEALKSAAGL